MARKNQVVFCSCENASKAYTEFDDIKQWYVCSDCKKPIEGTIEYFYPSENEFEPLEDDLE